MRRLAAQLLSERMRYRILYARHRKKWLDLDTPKRFTEKLYCRMQRPQEMFTTLADKYLVREYVAQTIGDTYLIPLYACTQHVTSELIASLPDAFVMKSNHGAGQVKIVRDKHQEDWEALATLANDWLKTSYSSYEKHYARIDPRILFEKLMLRGDNQPPADYKIHVFNGEREQYQFIQVIDGRFDRRTQNFFMPDWSPAPFNAFSPWPPSTNPEVIGRPANLDTMMTLANTLAAPFGYARIDVYLLDNRIYFGEITFTPAGGNITFIDDAWDKRLGSLFPWPDTAHALTAPSNDALAQIKA
ncbi:ATP-grasp fold amidoligase family protein [Larsenimonas suaedae]|uniref:ATP-grasp fold amidoligase family protein n=1 Tax=Larsenimonas suaedae TaxID=1851019 RepID=A0ABU1GTI8_9GAMM|nr:ATP-grasp fold amidoligase family protein [Larsenimonas suaedae]MCM2972397.1 hypothetical protein [Larsenimonas suaedae]MDR5894807.1 ATP-grasp fold amidoligase family protein [Larsenimonas suaedae]